MSALHCRALSAVVALGLVPVVGEELVDSGGWVSVDAAEDVLEVGEGLDSDGAARCGVRGRDGKAADNSPS
jgi:hypothetical protein